MHSAVSVTDFSHSIPGYKVDSALALNGATVLTVLNEVTGERFSVEGLSIEHLARPQIGKRIAEDLAVHVAGLPVKGVIRLSDHR